MEANAREILVKGGINFEEVLQRCMKNETLMARLLKKFPADTNYSKLVAAIAANDLEAAQTAAHTLKGVSGNLAITDLFHLLEKQMDVLRHDDLAAAAAMMPEIGQKYESAVQAINRALP